MSDDLGDGLDRSVVLRVATTGTQPIRHDDRAHGVKGQTSPLAPSDGISADDHLLDNSRCRRHRRTGELEELS